MSKRTAKITRKDGYQCAPEGHTVKKFECGEIVTGVVAEMAIADKAASVVKEKKSAGKAPENKNA